MQPDQGETRTHDEVFRKTPHAALPAASTAPKPESYEWRVPGKTLGVQIQLNVVDRLQQDLFAYTYDGSEALGILIGRTDVSGFRSTIVVTGCELIRNSGSAESPLARQKQLADIVGHCNAQGGEEYAVGLFRSQRGGNLALNESDLEISKCLFPRADNIFLVVQSTPWSEARGAFFFWEGRQIRANESYCEFTFDAAVLAAQPSHPMDVVAAESRIVNEGRVESAHRKIQTSWFTVGLVWALAVGSAMTCVDVLDRNKKNQIPRETISEVPVAPASTFQVEYSGRKIEVNLNHGLLTAAEADPGPLSDRQKQLLRYIAQDVPNDEIATRLGMTPQAVEFHEETLTRKLGVAGTAGLVRYALKQGLAEP